MSNATRLVVRLEVKSKAAQETLEAIKTFLVDPTELEKAGIDKILDISMEENSIEFTTTQREGYGEENATEIAKLLGSKFPYKITSFYADEITRENVFCIDDQEGFNDFMNDAD